MNFPLLRKKETDTADHSSKNIPSLFDSLFNTDDFDLFRGVSIPRIDVEEKDKEILVRAELPGIDKNNLNVSIQENLLTISGKKSRERKEEKEEGRCIRSERSYGSFSRTITLPGGIKKNKIKAEYKKGLLEIRLPKEKRAEPEKISVNVH